MIRRARFIARGPSTPQPRHNQISTSDLPEHWLSCILTGLSFHVLLLLVEHLYQPLRSRLEPYLSAVKYKLSDPLCIIPSPSRHQHTAQLKGKVQLSLLFLLEVLFGLKDLCHNTSDTSQLSCPGQHWEQCRLYNVGLLSAECGGPCLLAISVLAPNLIQCIWHQLSEFMPRRPGQ